MTIGFVGVKNKKAHNIFQCVIFCEAISEHVYYSMPLRQKSAFQQKKFAFTRHFILTNSHDGHVKNQL
jgi:hypothetical protein